MPTSNTAATAIITDITLLKSLIISFIKASTANVNSFYCMGEANVTHILTALRASNGRYTLHLNTLLHGSRFPGIHMVNISHTHNVVYVCLDRCQSLLLCLSCCSFVCPNPTSWANTTCCCPHGLFHPAILAAKPILLAQYLFLLVIFLAGLPLLDLVVLGVP